MDPLAKRPDVGVALSLGGGRCRPGRSVTPSGAHRGLLWGRGLIAILIDRKSCYMIPAHHWIGESKLAARTLIWNAVPLSVGSFNPTSRDFSKSFSNMAATSAAKPGSST